MINQKTKSILIFSFLSLTILYLGCLSEDKPSEIQPPNNELLGAESNCTITSLLCKVKSINSDSIILTLGNIAGRGLLITKITATSPELNIDEGDCQFVSNEIQQGGVIGTYIGNMKEIDIQIICKSKLIPKELIGTGKQKFRLSIKSKWEGSTLEHLTGGDLFA